MYLPWFTKAPPSTLARIDVDIPALPEDIIKLGQQLYVFTSLPVSGVRVRRETARLLSDLVKQFPYEEEPPSDEDLPDARRRTRSQGAEAPIYPESWVFNTTEVKSTLKDFEASIRAIATPVIQESAGPSTFNVHSTEPSRPTSSGGYTALSGVTEEIQRQDAPMATFNDTQRAEITTLIANAVRDAFAT